MCSFDNMSRGGECAFAEYISVGKVGNFLIGLVSLFSLAPRDLLLRCQGREVGLNTTAVFEDKLARGAALILKAPVRTSLLLLL